MKEKEEDIDLKSNSSKVEPVQEDNPNQGFMYYVVRSKKCFNRKLICKKWILGESLFLSIDFLTVVRCQLYFIFVWTI